MDHGSLDGKYTSKFGVSIMAQNPYENIADNSNAELARFCQEAARLREEDVSDFANLKNVFIAGRKVGKIPTGSADTTDTDRIGDFNYDADYMYLCVDDNGATWRRATLRSW